MENLSTIKVEQYPSGLTTFHIKEEEIFNENLPSPIIKKEEEGLMKLEHQPLDATGYVVNIDQRFEHLFDNLAQYLHHFIDVEDFELPFIPQNTQQTDQIIAKAKTYFREWGSDIIKSLREDIQKKGMHHTFPDSYIVETVEITKRRIFAGYKQLKKQIIEALSRSQQNKKSEHSKPQKTPRKSKYDFPPQAQELLRQWFVANAEDPYPTHEEKIELARKAGISMKQLDNWLTNTRGRIWKQSQKSCPKFENQIAEVLTVKGEI